MRLQLSRRRFTFMSPLPSTDQNILISHLNNMLGARARAAEYNAYKAATARQASREAEEQNLPPKAGPISLSAFTKNPHPNRNKGNKSYVPLVIEDSPDNDQISFDGHIEGEDNTGDYGYSTPTRSNTGPGVVRTQTKPESSIPATSGLQPIRINIPSTTVVPTAPKAMATAQDRHAPLINPTPRRIQPHSLVQHTQPSIPSSLHSTPSNPGGYSWCSVPHYSSQYNLQGAPYIGHVPYQPSNGPFHGSFMVPDDISPAKQENKLAYLSQVFSNTYCSQQPYPIPSGINYDMMFPHYSDGFAATPIDWTIPAATVDFPQAPPQRPEFPHASSDSVITADGEIATYFTPAPPALTRQVTYPEVPTTVSYQRQMIEQATKHAARRAEQRLASEDEPYDRNSKMQNFVAAQQALAKTGKTVLHNPDLYRSQGQANSTTISSAKTPSSISDQEFRNDYHEAVSNSKPSSIMKPPPGFEIRAASKLRFPIGTAADIPASKKFKELQKEFCVASEDWFELKSSSKIDRLRMNKLVRWCASVERMDEPRTLTTTSHPIRLEGLQNGIQEQNQGKRRAIDQVAKEHIIKRLSNMAKGNGLIDDDSSARVEGASIRAVGNILINIKDSRNPDLREADNAGYFCKYKPAPEYAVEKGGLMIGNVGSTSYFEEETGGFYTAPSRIARDPRFRPSGKEGMKPKGEGDWKLGHDLFVRRRL